MKVRMIDQVSERGYHTLSKQSLSVSKNISLFVVLLTYVSSVFFIWVVLHALTRAVMKPISSVHPVEVLNSSTCATVTSVLSGTLKVWASKSKFYYVAAAVS